MKTNSLLVCGAAAMALGLGAASLHVTRERIYTFHYENVLGTSLELKVDAASEANAKRAEKAVLDEIERERKILSAWDSGSEFSRWARTRGEAVAVSPELFEVLGLFDRWRERTGGALDPAAEAVTRVWKQAEAQQSAPAKEEIARAVEAVRQKHWTLDAAHRTATHRSDTPLALHSFAKSYIAGHAADAALAEAGVRQVVVNIGGDIVVRGPGSEPVDIANPLADAENAAPIATVEIHGKAIATSGNYRRGATIGGVHYSHIVDPRTGMPCDEILSSTVVAADPSDAGAMATAFSVLRPEESAQVAASVPGTEYLLITKSGRRIASPGFGALLASAYEPAPVPAPATASAWDGMQLTISFDLAQLQGSRVHRPYLAAWIEDGEKFPVRTLALWFNRDRWLPELRAWYRSDQARTKTDSADLAHSIASATRSPGHYTLEWDGKDNAGKLVKPGKYTVYLECTREHGGYDLFHHEIDFNGTPSKADFPGGTELAGASLDYHKAAR